MTENKYPLLFEPIRIAGTFFRNRIFSAPMDLQDLDRFGVYADTATAYYERRAMGGAASVTLGECCVDGKRCPHDAYHIRMDDPYSVRALGRIANAVSRYGSVLSAELQHAGMYTNQSINLKEAEAAWDVIGPVDAQVAGLPVRGMNEQDIEYIIKKYAAAALAAKNVGFGMVTIHAGHGWLLNQFLSPSINTRTDKWGGADVENRARLPVEIIKAIKKECGRGFPVEIRISGSECYDGGYDIGEGVAIAKQLDGHADLINVSVGVFENNPSFYITHPNIFKEDGCNVKYAAEIKKHVTLSKVSTVGAIDDPAMMEDIIASGKADVIELARALLCDPDLPKKVRTGHEDDVRKCIRCLNCFSCALTNGQFYCALNPQASREYEARYEIPAAEKKKVLIAGGGMAGMQAAITAAQRGHQVILCEKTDTLGGVLRCEENVPFKARLKQYMDYQAAQVKKAGVEIRMNTEVSPEYASGVGADVVIACLGARPVKPAIDGIDGDNVVSAEAAYTNPSLVGESAVILGAGLVGIELGIYLAMLGKKITVVEMMDKVNDGGNFLHVGGLMVEAEKYKLDLHLSTRALEITDKGVVCQAADGKKLFCADTVIYAVGQRPLNDEGAALRDCADEFYQIGDCVAPKNIMNATGTAYTISRSIGRPMI